MVAEGGWELPAVYEDRSAEQVSASETVALIDVTPRAKVDVRGRPDEVLSSAGDPLVARVEPGWALVLAPPGEEEILLPKLTAAAGPTTMVTDATHLFVGLAFAGPRVQDAFELLTSWDPSTLATGAATGAPVADVPAVLVRRALGLQVLEVFVASEFARYVWECCLDAVRRVGGRPAGWATLRALGWS